MPYEFIEIDDEIFDMITDIEFSAEQNDSTILEVINRMTRILRRGRLGNRFEEVVALEITPTKCQIQLRYFTQQKRDRLGQTECGYEDVLGIWFVKYLFANVNDIRKIKSHPFGAYDLSSYLELSDPFDNDPLPNS